MRRRLLPAAFAVALAGIAAGWSSQQSAAQRMWLTSPYVKLQAATAVAPWKASLVAPRGGRASFQLVVDGGERVRPVPSSLRGPGGAKLRGAVSVLRELTVPVTARSSAVARGLLGDVPDPLVPLSVRPRSVSSRQVFWVSIEVPRSLRAGVYRGTVRAGSRSVAYRLRVADVTLPRRRALHTWFLVWSTHADSAEHHSDAGPAYTRALARYGVGDGTAAGGDAAVGVPPDSLASDASDATLQRIARGVAAAATRLRARVPGAAPYSYVIDEPSGGQLDQVRRWGDALSHDAPGVRQLVTATPDPSLGNSVGAWAMHLRALTPSVLATTHGLGAEAWVYSSCCETPGDPTLLLDQDAVGNLAVAPAAWQQGAAGLFYWSVNDYTGDPYTDARNHIDEPARVGNGDGVLLYPGRPLGLRAPTPSLRLALVAAGLQIADEAALLARRGQGRARARAPGHGRVRRQPRGLAGRRAGAAETARARVTGRNPRHVLMVADIDLGLPDARRVHVSEIARGLRAAGCEVELVSRGPDPLIDGVRYRAAAASGSGKLDRLARVNAVAISRAVSRRQDARSLYVRYDWGLLPTIVAGRALGYRVVLEVNALTSVDVDPSARLGLILGIRERVKRAAVGAAWRSSYRLLPVTKRLRDTLVDVFGAPAERVEIVTNGADTELFAPSDRTAALQELGLDPADEHVLFVGLLAWWNDFPTVIAAFAEVVSRRPRALLVFVGDGDERAAVEELVRDHGISERVRFAGFVEDRSLVATYVAAARVCLSPGSAELAIGRPMKLAEYLAAGRAVVGSAIPGITEMLAETGGGVAVAPHDPSGMADALCEMLADPVAADALGLSARAAIVERYSWRAIANRLAAIFQ